MALAAAVAMVGVVFMAMPGWLARPSAPAPVAAPPATPAPAPALAHPPSASEAVHERLAAEEAKSRYETQLKALRAQGADTWATEDLAAIVGMAKAAAAAVGAGDYAGGKKGYEQASELLAGVAGRAETVYAEALKRGESAIQAGEQAEAVEAFRLAAAIHPDAAAAQSGLARAGKLDQMLAQMKSGAAHAQAGEWEAARDAYLTATKLDPAFAPAKEALAQAERKVADQRFTQVITRGLAHLDRGEWADAERAFQSAARLRPGDRSAIDGLARAKEGLERNTLASIRSEAQQLESAERWSDALAAYRRAAAIDPALDFAKRGIARSEKMATLHAELDQLLRDPKRLYSPPVRAQAREVLAAVESAPAGGPQLAQARQRLEAALQRATTPVAVRLASDGITDVTVYSIGALGRFRSREIDVAPGTYTIVGSRAGYKDVRIELTVDPDKPPAQAFVACKEPM